MKEVKTDSLGLEILSSIHREEFKKEIKVFKSKDELLMKNKQIEKMTLFEMYDQEKIVGYFILDTKKYNKWILDYKMEGIEI